MHSETLHRRVTYQYQYSFVKKIATPSGTKATVAQCVYSHTTIGAFGINGPTHTHTHGLTHRVVLNIALYSKFA